MKIKQRRKNRPLFDSLNGLRRVHCFTPDADNPNGGGGSGTGTSASTTDADTPLELTETAEEKAERLEAENKTLRELAKQRENEIKNVQASARNAHKQAIESLPSQLATLDKIKEAVKHLGLDMNIDPKAPIADNYNLFNEKVIEEFKLIYKVGEDHETDFENIFSQAKNKLLANKVGGNFGLNLPEGEVEFHYEGNKEYEFLMNRDKGVL